MISNNPKNQTRLFGLGRVIGITLVLLLTQPTQADFDQLPIALIQTEASLKSLEQGGTQGAAAHAEAARSHVEIAARDATGQTPPGPDHLPKAAE